jgi:hypothetical protein
MTKASAAAVTWLSIRNDDRSGGREVRMAARL